MVNDTGLLDINVKHSSKFFWLTRGDSGANLDVFNCPNVPILGSQYLEHLRGGVVSERRWQVDQIHLVSDSQNGGLVMEKGDRVPYIFSNMWGDDYVFEPELRGALQPVKEALSRISFNSDRAEIFDSDEVICSDLCCCRDKVQETFLGQVIVQVRVIAVALPRWGGGGTKLY